MSKIYNFSSGPAMLPVEVLQRAKEELCNWNSIGTSVMEISHRSKEFLQVTEKAEKDLRDLLAIPDNYKVLFCHGGARAQFAALPMNLLGIAKTADYVNSGYWAYSAIQEAKKYCIPNILNIKVRVDDKYALLPMCEWSLSDNTAYVHFCPNETIDGLAIDEQPNFGDKVVAADFSSTILSRPIDIKCYGIIYASAQKNIGPAGLTLVIVREDLLGKAWHTLPSVLDYKTLADNNSMFNTPPTFAWYMSGLVFQWLKRQGGVSEIEKINQAKADLLYGIIDRSGFYRNDVSVINRSRMNIPFRLVNATLEPLFFAEAFAAGLHALKGHRTVGGMRASIYNAMPFEGVQALADFMIDFERHHG